VSCAEWPRLADLVGRRLERAAAGEAETLLSSEAFAHLETCPSCRGAAVSVDPTLALRPLAAAGQEAPDGEVEAMQRAVETLRRTRGGARRRSAGAAWWRVAAAAALAAGALYQLPGWPRGAARAPVDPLLEALASQPAAANVVPAELSSLPLVEDLDRPDARVYQLGGGDVSVVMIVDETLDV
jgi:hypothetical protein